MSSFTDKFLRGYRGLFGYIIDTFDPQKKLSEIEAAEVDEYERIIQKSYNENIRLQELIGRFDILSSRLSNAAQKNIYKVCGLHGNLSIAIQSMQNNFSKDKNILSEMLELTNEMDKIGLEKAEREERAIEIIKSLERKKCIDKTRWDYMCYRTLQEVLKDPNSDEEMKERARKLSDILKPSLQKTLSRMDLLASRDITFDGDGLRVEIKTSDDFLWGEERGGERRKKRENEIKEKYTQLSNEIGEANFKTILSFVHLVDFPKICRYYNLAAELFRRAKKSEDGVRNANLAIEQNIEYMDLDTLIITASKRCLDYLSSLDEKRIARRRNTRCSS